MGTQACDARLDFRLRSEIKAKIEQAAAVSGQSVSDFAVSTLHRAAEEVLEKRRALTLSERDFRRFLALLEEDAPPNEALRRAAERYNARRA